ncbi:MAG: molybdenum cofactor biosynthesis protein MoaE [Gammaproteobacteria bacterium]|nr:molybdenum cofactor biosynthesis protein MoaE [Gammaproteobacteria bacterium]
MNNFIISQDEIDFFALNQQFKNPNAGAMSSFQGVVRKNNLGKEVLRLEYQSYDRLAQKEGGNIINEALESFDIESAYCMHRTGVLEIGDIAVVVIVLAGHREDSFKACRYIIDEVKLRVPIWKKEIYQNGDSGWLKGAG